MIVGRDCVGDIVFLRRSSARSAIASVVEIENAEAAFSNLFNFGRATGGVCSVSVEIKDSRFVFLRRCMPGNQCDPIGNRDLDFLYATQASRHRCDPCWIGKIHQRAIAKIGCRTNCRIDATSHRMSVTTSCFIRLTTPLSETLRRVAF